MTVFVSRFTDKCNQLLVAFQLFVGPTKIEQRFKGIAWVSVEIVLPDPAMKAIIVKRLVDR